MNKITKVFLGVLSFILIILIVLIKSKKELYLDTTIYNSISRFINNDLTTIVKIITSFGSAKVIVCLALLSVCLLKDKFISLSICLSLIISISLNHLFKLIMYRSRPTMYNLIKENGCSFPSGHTTVSVVFYGFIIYLIHKYIRNMYLKIVLISLISLLIICIGLSRVYLGVHYFSDVLGGILFGLIMLIILINIAKKYQVKL